MILRPEKGLSAVNNRMTDSIKIKYGVKKEVNKDFDSQVNPVTAQTQRIKERDDELREERKKKMLANEG
jgi:hypothetical protein